MANESEYANKNEKFQINLLFKYPSTILILIKKNKIHISYFYVKRFYPNRFILSLQSFFYIYLYIFLLFAHK